MHEALRFGYGVLLLGIAWPLYCLGLAGDWARERALRLDDRAEVLLGLKDGGE